MRATSDASAELVELLAVRERLDAVILTVAGAWDREQAWALDGAVSPVAWLAHRCPLTRQDASVLIRTARHVTKHEKTAKALDAGDIAAIHAQIAARAVKHREDHYPEHEDVILDAARTLDPADFREVMRHWAKCADAISDPKNKKKQQPRRDLDENYFDIAKTFAEVGHVEGRFDALSIKTLIDVLDALEPPDPADRPGGPRTLSQRRAAALIRLATGETPPPVNLDILCDQDTFAGRMPVDLTRSVCELCGWGPISPAVVSMLACDAAIGRVVRRGESEVLDLGRRHRLVTPAQRRALHLRDRGCVEPGCTAPAHWCDAHHIIPWTRHGPTNLNNLELRCRRHHLQQHQHDHTQTMASRE